MRKLPVLFACLMLIPWLCLNGCEKNEEIKWSYKQYIYSYTTWKGETSYFFTNLPPERVEEEYDDHTFVRVYESENGVPDMAFDMVGSVCLFKDPDWFLYDVETGEKTPVSLNEDPEKTRTYVLLGDTEPAAVAIFHRETERWGIFSIGADRMISDYEYVDIHHKEMIDGKIAVLTEEGAYLLDPLTGEFCGEADAALFEE